MTTNCNKNLWYFISLSLLLFSISFLANSDATSNAFETTTSTATSTESDVNTSDVNIPDVNNSDVNTSETLALTLYPHQLMWKALASKSFWYPGPQALWKIRSGSTGFILCSCVFSLQFFVKTICLLKLTPTVFGKCQPKLICVLIYQNFLHLDIIFLTQAGLAYL